MSKSKSNTYKFKLRAVKQVTEREYSMTEVAERLDICTNVQ